MTVKITATKEDIVAFENRCALTEAMMAQTLAARIEGMTAEGAQIYIADWFKSVRDMAVGNWILSDIKTEIK